MRGNALLIGFGVSLLLVWLLFVAGVHAVFAGYPLAVRARPAAEPAPLVSTPTPCRPCAM